MWLSYFLVIFLLELFVGQNEGVDSPHKDTALFDEFNAHFAHFYRSAEEYETALEHFHKNLALLGADHAQNLSHLRDILERTEGSVKYGLNPTLNRDISQNGYVPIDPADMIDLSTPWRRFSFSVKRLLLKLSRSTSGGLENDDDYCKKNFRLRDNPLRTFSSPPLSVDLRELGLIDLARNQGFCGCCWAMASAALYEISVRSTRNYFQSDSAVDGAFKDPHFKASEQYIMNKSYQSNNYCQGGNYVTVSRDYAVHQELDTLESLTNFPFESFQLTTNPDNIKRDAQMKVKNAFVPGNTVTVASCPAAIFRVYDSGAADSDFKSSVKVAKSLLARGIPIVITMSTVANGKEETQKAMQSYKSGILDVPCTNNVIDHQVIIVGYGRKNGVDVWVVRNSWGERWGSKGHFYAPIGKNSLCTEQQMYTEIPRYFPLNKKAADQLYANRASSLKDNVWDNILQRGNENSLDVDPVRNSISSKSGSIIIALVFIPIVVAIVALTSYILCNNKKKKHSQRGVNI
ncbi:Cathepsin L-like protease [Giardia duodenalis]|uniref:Cathepsin L-like protease n=1 Tax=Giardia intestinalis (strain ATCC 50803 / WB clone C6) TaxID=184922 RepID=A8BT10_GIAIC|nr:Cathepsin L-like protease [Giardia intestinalis]KAE8305929.1 Cathepsin L-like protease [Giardia intestinalis]|eukprot:XP_001705004.1 Cathepsin L-like protease [Giardia lamblia ATCC 50803]